MKHLEKRVNVISLCPFECHYLIIELISEVCFKGRKYRKADRLGSMTGMYLMAKQKHKCDYCAVTEVP